MIRLDLPFILGVENDAQTALRERGADGVVVRAGRGRR